MFKKVLIANRGEIAVRVIRACRELGIATAAVYSEADQDSLHVKLADEAYCIGPAPSRDSYLNMTNLISTATLIGADAVHPGYGFLAENADFAELCAACGITFIGPHPDAISKMGDKTTARETMKRAGVPVVPGTEGVIEDLDAALETAASIGYPVMVKATAGGGGKGMRVVHSEDELETHHPDGTAGSRSQLRQSRGVPREVSFPPEARGDSDFGRPARQCDPFGGTRLFHPAKVPETDRRGPFPRSRPRS